MQPTFEALLARASATPADAGAMLDLSTLLQLVGQREQGLALQADALARQRHYRKRLGTGEGPRLLALVAAGDLMASTPVEFLLAGWNGELDLIFLTPGDRLDGITEHDIAILAVGESDANAPILDGLGRDRSALAAADAERRAGRDPRARPRPRAGAARRRARASSRRRPAASAAPSSPRASPSGFPIIVRPVDSHAGAGLEKLDEPGRHRRLSRAPAGRALLRAAVRRLQRARTAASASCASRWWPDARSSSTWPSPTTGWSTTSTPAWPTTPPSAPRKPR